MVQSAHSCKVLLLVVAVEIAAERAHHNHGDDPREKQHDGQRIDDREPGQFLNTKLALRRRH